MAKSIHRSHTRFKAGASVIPFRFHRHIPLIRRPFFQRDRAVDRKRSSDDAAK